MLLWFLYRLALSFGLGIDLGGGNFRANGDCPFHFYFFVVPRMDGAQGFVHMNKHSVTALHLQYPSLTFKGTILQNFKQVG